MTEGYVGLPVLLELALIDRATGKFPRARITDDAGVQIGVPVNLSPTPPMAWVYTGTWIPPAAGQYSATFETYNDAGFTTLSTHEPAIEHLLIHRLEQDATFQKLLGHSGENVRDDVLAYDANMRPLTFRRRIFPDKATADASTPGGTGEGEIATVVGAATHFDAARWETLLRTLSP